LSYTPGMGTQKVENPLRRVNREVGFRNLMVRATDAKEVGVENPAEETFCHSNQGNSGNSA